MNKKTKKSKIKNKSHLFKKIAMLIIVVLLFYLILKIIISDQYKDITFTSVGVYAKSNNPILGYELRSGLDTRPKELRQNESIKKQSIDWYLQTNKQGIRGEEFNIEKEQNEKRIVVVGDSISLGLGVDNHETFSYYLEQKLNEISTKSKEPKKHYRVINFGRSGYNTIQEVELIKTKVLDYKPDLIILQFFYNDFSWNEPLLNAMLTQKEEKEVRNFVKRNVPLTCKIKMKLEELVFIDIFMKTKYPGRITIQQLIDETNKLFENKCNWALFESQMEKLSKIAKNEDIPILFVTAPYIFEVENNLFGDFRERINDIAKKKGFITIDLLEVYNQTTTDKLHYESNIEEIHPGSYGHKLISNRIYDELLKSALI